jgi:hypothetical protein
MRDPESPMRDPEDRPTGYHPLVLGGLIAVAIAAAIGAVVLFDSNRSNMANIPPPNATGEPAPVPQR